MKKFRRLRAETIAILTLIIAIMARPIFAGTVVTETGVCARPLDDAQTTATCPIKTPGQVILDSVENMLTVPYCEQRVRDAGVTEVTYGVNFSGSAWEPTPGWIVQHDTVTVIFDGEPPRIWSRETVPPELHGALGDWIGTALNFEASSGLPTFAWKSEGGAVSITSEAAPDSDFRCFGHTLK